MDLLNGFVEWICTIYRMLSVQLCQNYVIVHPSMAIESFALLVLAVLIISMQGVRKSAVEAL
jgi:hypothetical protein